MATGYAEAAYGEGAYAEGAADNVLVIDAQPAAVTVTFTAATQVGETPRLTVYVTLSAVVERTDVYTPPNAVGGRTRLGSAIARWEPPVVDPPATFAPVHARVAAHAYTSVTMNGTRPQMSGLVTADRQRHRDRILVAGRDVTYWRGVPTPLPKFGLVSPLLWGSGTLELPQVAACFETPGQGALSWLREGAPVVIQRVLDGTVVATDYRGVILGFGTSGRSLTVDLGGDALGRASLRDKQPPIFKRRNDLGWWWWHALAGPDGLTRPFLKVGGATTGIKMYETGGTRLVDHLNELAAKGVNLAGTQWTCTPYESGTNAGVYRVHRKDTDTINATVYLDDAHTVASLQADASERPNRIYGTGVTPKGERARFGIYPVLADQQRARFPNYTDGRVIKQGDTNADTDSNGGVTALLRRLAVTGYLSTDNFAGGYDIDVTRAVRDLQDDAGLPQTGNVNTDTWRALFDEDVIGFSTRGSRIEPIAQANSVKRVRRNASGQVVGTNPGYNPRRLVVDRTLDFGTGITRGQMRQWARADLASGTPGSDPSGNGRHWTGTIRFELGAVIKGTHTPGDPVTASDIMHARSLRPGMNLWLPLFDGGTKLHIAGVDVDSERQVTVSVDTRARDTMTVWEVISRNQENRRNPARAWIRDHRSSSFVKDAVTEFDEIGGTSTDQQLDAGWNVFPVVAGQEGTIARLRIRTQLPVEFVVAVFGRRVGPKWLASQVANPLTAAGSKRWEDEAVRNRLDAKILLYAAGNDEQPGGYSPSQKATTSDPGGPLTGRFDDDAGFGYRTFDQSCILWVAVYAAAATTLQGGRIMWPQLEAGA